MIAEFFGWGKYSTGIGRQHPKYRIKNAAVHATRNKNIAHSTCMHLTNMIGNHTKKRIVCVLLGTSIDPYFIPQFIFYTC